MNRFFTRSELIEVYRLPKQLHDQFFGEVDPVENTDRREALYLEAHVDAWLTARYATLIRGPGDESCLTSGLPRELSTEEAAIILGQSKDTVLKLRSEGVLPFRNAAPPGSSRPVYRFPLEAVVKLRTTYETDEPTPRMPKQPGRRQAKGKRKYKYIDYD
jgi:hypothetical protein